VTCKKTGIKVILHYVEEGYFGKTQNKVEGVVYKTDVDSDTITRIKDVSDKNVLGRIDGCWQDKVYFSYGPKDFKKTDEKDRVLLIDLSPLFPAPKICPPPEDQLPNESRRFWGDVTEAITNKQFSRATELKTQLEERQRERAAERKTQNLEWKPRFFTGAVTPRGVPELSEEGVAVMNGLHTDNFKLQAPAEYGAL